MMNVRRPLACLLLAVLLIPSCVHSSEEDTKPEQPFEEEQSVRGLKKETADQVIEMPDNVVFVKDDLETLMVDFDEEGGTISFEDDQVLAGLNLKPGDILYSSTRTPEHPDGYCLRIVSMTPQTKDTDYGAGSIVSIETEPATAMEAFDYLKETVIPQQCTLPKEDYQFFRLDLQPDLNKITDEILDDAVFEQIALGDRLSITPGEKESSFVYVLLKEENDDIDLTVTLTGTVQHDFSKGITKEFDHGHFLLDLEAGWGAKIDLGVEAKMKNMNGEVITKEQRAEYVKRMKSVQERVMGRQVLLFTIPFKYPGDFIADPSIDILWDFRIEEIDGEFHLEIGGVDAKHKLHFENTEPWSVNLKSPLITEINPMKPLFDVRGELHGTLATGPAIGLVVSLPMMRFDAEGDRYKRVRKWKNFKGRSIKSYAGAYFELLLEGDIDMKGVADLVTGSYQMQFDVESKLRLDVFVEYLLGFKKALVGYDQKRWTWKTWELGHRTWTLQDNNTQEFCVQPVLGAYVPFGNPVVLKWETNRKNEGVLEFDVYLGSSPEKMSLLVEKTREKQAEVMLSLPDKSTQYWCVVVRTPAGIEYNSPVWFFHIGDDPGLSSAVGHPKDLGLPSGLLWADHNIGAEMPVENGAFYAWGERPPVKYTFTRENYVWLEDDLNTLTKYNLDPRLGRRDDKLILDPADDAARASWGGSWRMPTEADFRELMEHAKWEWKELDENYGFLITGTNGNDIFLPAAGFSADSETARVGAVGLYWTSSLGASDSYHAQALYFEQDRPKSVELKDITRYVGMSIRPVQGAGVHIPRSKVEVDTAPLNFVVSKAGSSLTKTLAVKNVGDGDLSLYADGLNDAFSVEIEQMHGLAPGQTTTVSVTFTPPSGETEYGGTLVLHSNAVNPDIAIPVTGRCGNGGPVSGAVDLGLSVKWASANIGASSPEDVGAYYAWGELTTKSSYSQEGYLHLLGDGTMGKYNGTDGVTILDPEDDIVHQSLMGNWRMPTIEEWDELRQQCTWNEVKNGDELLGYDIVGANGASIYLPVTGYKQDSEIQDASKARYWSSTRGDNVGRGRALNEAQNNYGTWGQYADPGDSRFLGLAVRGVYDDAADAVSQSAYVDLGLSVKWAGTNMGASSCEETGTRYAWGDFGNHDSFDWASYIFSPDGTATFTKYNNTDGLKYLLRENDAVYCSHDRGFQAFWRIPTIEEWQELKDNCTWTKATRNARRGYIIQSNINGNSIFLPIGGYIDGTQRKDGMNPRYWSSSKAEHEDKARALNEAQNNYGTWGQYASPGDPRCFGMPLRGVYDDRAPSVSHEDYVDLGLSVKWAGANMGAASCEETGTRYAWGDSGKTSTFDWESYPFSTDGTDFTRYNSTDGLQYLLRENDAVYRTHPRSLEASWRIPSLEEWQELQDGCTWTEAILNGVRGYVIQSKVNSNAIFLPLTGYLDGTQLKDGMKPRYWSSTKAEHVDKARALNEAQNNYGTWGQYAAPGDPRCFGMPLRGVYDDSFGKRNLSEGELIDMGLSVKWARCNEGGSSPEESGSFFAWGELESKGSYVWATYRYANEDGSTMLKYNSTDKLNLLEKEDDLVAMRHGGMWRMPTIDHWNELWENCTAELVWANGVRGYFLTSNINGNTLFIPLSGYLDDDQRKDCMKPRYWSSTKAEHLDKARALNEAQNYYGTWGQYAAPGDPRCFGMPVRGVYDNTDVSVSPGDYIDLGLSVKWASMNIGSSEPEEFGKFYAWGETQSKGSFSWDNYKFMDAATSGMSKYNNTDGLTVLERTDDVAYVTRGGGCRMPTVDEWTELKENCEWKEVVRYGRKGFKISSSNGNSIFLPITGFKEESLIKDGATAHYWSSTRGATVTHGRALNEAQNYHGTWGQFTDPGDNRFLGMPVRAVRE